MAKYGGDTEYRAQHKRVAAARGKASSYRCELNCGQQAHDWALIHGRDAGTPDSYMPLCRKCHLNVYDRVPGSPKLSEEQVREIRVRREWFNETCRAIAADYNVTPEQVSNIVLRKRWGWVDAPCMGHA